MSHDTGTDENLPQTEQRPAPRPLTPVHSDIPVLDTHRFDHMQRIATVMADASLTPRHLTHYREGKGNAAQWIPLERKHAAANCFLVVNQAVRWGMDPFALAPHAYEVGGKLGFEGQAVIAVINASPKIRGKLRFRYEGERFKPSRKIVVSAVMAEDGSVEEVEGTVAQWRTDNTAWQRQPDEMLAYRGARVWARLHLPEVLLGIYTTDELEEMRDGGSLQQQPGGHYAPAPAPQSEPPSAPPEKEPVGRAEAPADARRPATGKGKPKSDKGKQKPDTDTRNTDSVNPRPEAGAGPAPESDRESADDLFPADKPRTEETPPADDPPADWKEELRMRMESAASEDELTGAWDDYESEREELRESDPESFESLRQAFSGRMKALRA